MRGRIAASLFAVGLLLLGACGDDDDVAPAAQPGAESTSASAEAAPSSTVAVATHAQLGQLLVGPNGHTLYMFAKDTGTTSACSGGCAANWPALTVTGAPTAGAGVDAAKLSVANGHVVYDGHLLYFFAADMAPGDAKGAAVPNWFALDPAGNKIEPK